MSKTNRKRNKRYIPKPCHLPSIFGMSKKMSTDLRLPAHLFLEAFRTGHGTEEAAHSLAACMNIGARLSAYQSEEVQEAMSAALDACQAMMDRGNSTGKWGLSGDELKALGEGVNLTNEMQDASMRRQVMNAIHETMRVATA